jgi:hypothetical protein
MKMAEKKIFLGKGILTWTRHERIGDRYGIVFLMQDGQTSETPERDGIELNGHGYESKRGKLVVNILDARESSHIGDLFHGFFPSTPEIGERIELGEGELFFESYIGNNVHYDCVGLKPNDNRETFWLNPQRLYKVHEQLVELYFEYIES